MEQLTKNQAVATSQEAVQNQNEPQLRDENAHNDKSVHGVLNPTYQAGLRRDAVQPDIEAEQTEDDFDFLTSNKVWIATDRSRARRCVEACVYGTLDFVGYPRFPAPVEFIAAVIAYYVHPVNIQTACLIMEGAEFTENIIN